MSKRSSRQTSCLHYLPPSTRTSVSIPDCGVSHPTKQLGHGRRGWLAVRFLLIRGGARFVGLFGANNLLYVAREGRSIYISEGMVRDSDQNDRVRVLSSPPPCEIEGADGEGWTSSDSPLRPLPAATSTSATSPPRPLSSSCAGMADSRSAG